MTLYDLRTEAHAFTEAWHSIVLGRIGTANLNVLPLAKFCRPGRDK